MRNSKLSYLKDLRAFWEIDDTTELKYNRVDTLYGEGRSPEKFESLLDERVAWILSEQSFPTKPKILEIGCGIGVVIQRLVSKIPDAEIWGYDISRAMVNESKKLLENYSNVHIQLTEGDRLDNIPDDSIDLVICSGVFIHVLSLDVIVSYLGEALRVLKPNGSFRFNVRYRNPSMSFGNSLGGKVAKFLYRVGWYSALRSRSSGEVKPKGFEGLMFSLDEIDTLCRTEGFELDKITFTTHSREAKPNYVRLNCRKSASSNAT